MLVFLPVRIDQVNLKVRVSKANLKVRVSKANLSNPKKSVYRIPSDQFSCHFVFLHLKMEDISLQRNSSLEKESLSKNEREEQANGKSFQVRFILIGIDLNA